MKTTAPWFELGADDAFGLPSQSVTVEAQRPLQIVDAQGDDGDAGFMSELLFAQSRRNASTATGLGPGRPAGRPNGLMVFSSKWLRNMATPAGLGALAITVRPPPVTAPADQRHLEFLAQAFDQRAQIGERRIVGQGGERGGAKEDGGGRPCPTGWVAATIACRPPRTTSPARKMATSRASRRISGFWCLS